LRLAQGFLAGGALALAGCIGWTDAYSGPAYTTAGREKRNGPTFGVESIFSPRPHTALNRGSQTFPVAIHNGFQLTLSPDLKTFSWLTGVALWGHPEPVSGYALAGTNLHVDLLNSRFSFGNFQPYGEVGVAGRLGNRGDDEDGLIVTLGMQFMFLYNYLAQNEPASDGYISIKFGLGWDVH
jgi:hypothetical protein